MIEVNRRLSIAQAPAGATAEVRGGYGGDIELNEAASLSAQLNRQSMSLVVDAQRGNSSAADAALVDDATTAASRVSQS